MREVYTARHADQRDIVSADQVELQAIQAGSAVTEVGVHDEEISGEADDLDVGVEVDVLGALGEVAIQEGAAQPRRDMRFMRQDVMLETEVGGIRDEILRRSALMGEAYPFKLNDNLLTYEPSKTRVYEYCLGISFAPSLTKRPFTKLPRSFEQVSALIIKLHLGPSWQMFHTGHPRSMQNGYTFLKAMSNLSQASSSGREWRYNPEPGYAILPGRLGDEGMDFAVWRPSSDARIGQIFVAGQCACGNDWPEKFSDLSKKRLGTWFRPPAHVEIVRSFATPFLMSEGNFLAAHRDANWTLDRTRLSMMAAEMADDPELAGQVPAMIDLFQLSRQPKERDFSAPTALA